MYVCVVFHTKLTFFLNLIMIFCLVFSLFRVCGCGCVFM